MKFIYFCMAILVGSFIAVPIFTGVSKEHTALMATATPVSSEPSSGLQDIYEIARQGGEDFNPDDLNNITPAAGDDMEIAKSTDGFSMGFRGIESPSLADTEDLIEITPQTDSNFE